MERRRLGKTDMDVSVLGFGGSEIGYQNTAPTTVARLLTRALDAGLNVIDTAKCYEDSEVLIGQAVRARRRDAYLFTKCGHGRGWRENSPYAALLESIERSLRRLETDHLDLIQLHSCSLAELRRGDVIAALERGAGARAGRVTSDIAATARRRATPIECGRFDTLQTSVSIADQEAMKLTLPLAHHPANGRDRQAAARQRRVALRAEAERAGTTRTTGRACGRSTTPACARMGTPR